MEGPRPGVPALLITGFSEPGKYELRSAWLGIYTSNALLFGRLLMLDAFRGLLACLSISSDLFLWSNMHLQLIVSDQFGLKHDWGPRRRLPGPRPRGSFGIDSF